jgi:apolipoprotein N-acyltransferase
LSVALVQAEPGFTGSVATMQRLTRQVSQRADLVCWPESSSGTYASTLTQFSDPGQIFEQSREPDRGLRPWPSPDCSLLVGATIYDGNRDRPKANYQSALLIDPHEQIVGIYRKRHLMPFGEYVPGEDWFPWRQSAFSSDDALSCGNQANVLSDGGKARLGVLLCYEDMLPSAAASMTVNSANLLISLINASAFEAALPRYQHRMLAQLRAVENRRYLLRCAATGETCVVSPWGTIEARLPLGDEGVLKANVALLENPTWANWGSHGLAACCVAGMVWFWLRARSA